MLFYGHSVPPRNDVWHCHACTQGNQSPDCSHLFFLSCKMLWETGSPSLSSRTSSRLISSKSLSSPKTSNTLTSTLWCTSFVLLNKFSTDQAVFRHKLQKMSKILGPYTNSSPSNYEEPKSRHVHNNGKMFRTFRQRVESKYSRGRTSRINNFHQIMYFVYSTFTPAQALIVKSSSITLSFQVDLSIRHIRYLYSFLVFSFASVAW